MTSKSLFKVTTMLVPVLLAAGASGAQAQDQSNAPIEEIIVSATKRAQTLQEVPIAVSAYGAEQLQNAGVTDLRELSQISPSLFLTSSSSEAAGAVARIRGIGTTGDNPGLESSVAIFVDGVYRSRTNVGLTELGEIERIEVLRGPQGTLFGRNASAGLINVITKGPTEELSGYAEGSYGNYNYMRMAGGVSGPIGESNRVAARLDGVYFTRDGFMEDKVTGADYNNRDRWLLRGQLRLDATDDLSLRIIGDYAKRNEECCAAATIVRGAAAQLIEGLGGKLGSGGSPAGSDPYDRLSATSTGRGYQQDVEEWGLSVQADWTFDAMTLTSITAYRDWHNDRSQDIDFTSLDLLYRDANGFVQEFQTFSQELRLNGQAGRLDWLIGGYYADEDLSLDDAVRFGRDYEAYANALVRQVMPSFPGYTPFTAFVTSGAITNAFPTGGGAAADNFDQNSKNWALFTHNIVELSDMIDLTLGLRYTHESKTLDASVVTANPTCTALAGAAAMDPSLVPLLRAPCLPFFNPFMDGVYAAEHKESELSGAVAINVTFNDQLSSYVSYSRGYKAGGFNLDRAGLANPLTGGAPSAADLEFNDETVDSYELGAKFRSADRLFSLNAALFYSKFTDFQLNTFNGVAFVVENLPSAKTRGVEVEGSFQPLENLNFSGGVTYADTDYGDNFEGAIFAPPSAANPEGGVLWQLPGNTLTNAPKWAVTGGVSYEHPLGGDLKALLHLDFRYSSEVNTGSDLDVEKLQDGVAVFNGRVGLGHVDDRWSIELWGRNLFNADYMQVAFDAPLQGSGTARNTVLPNTQIFNAFLAEPRTYGVTVRGRF